MGRAGIYFGHSLPKYITWWCISHQLMDHTYPSEVVLCDDIKTVTGSRLLFCQLLFSQLYTNACQTFIFFGSYPFYAAVVQSGFALLIGLVDVGRPLV